MYKILTAEVGIYFIFIATNCTHCIGIVKHNGNLLFVSCAAIFCPEQVFGIIERYILLLLLFQGIYASAANIYSDGIIFYIPRVRTHIWWSVD